MLQYNLFNMMEEAVAVYEYKNGQFIIYDFNPRAEELENVKKEDIIGRDVIEVFPGVIQFGLLDVFKEVYKTGIPKKHPITLYKDDCIHSWRKNKVYKVENKIVAIYKDISKEKTLEKKVQDQEQLFKDFFKKNKFVILEIDPKTQQIVDCNQTATTFYGYSWSELTAMKISDLNVLEEKELKILIKNAIRKKKNHFIFQHRLADGSVRDIETYTSPIHVGNGKIHLFSFINDITEKLKAQKASIENHRLNAIGEMASAIAHDFNNSLQAISGNIELFAHKHQDLEDSMKKEVLRINNSVNDVASRIQALLKFSAFKGEATNNLNLYKKTLSIKEIINDIIFQTRPLWKGQAERKGIKINIIQDIPQDFFIKGNKGLLSSALFNIIKNAIEAMPKGGTLTFSLKREDSCIVLRVKDTGVGMNETTKLRIFQPFYSTKGYETGRGQGMSGAYQIINNCQGNISVENTILNQGTTIKITFPFIETLQEIKEVLKEPNQKKESPQKRILWLDDDRDLNVLMRKYLDYFNLRGDIASSGQEAIQYLKNKTYDLIITDIGMPDMNGWDFVEIVRNTLKLKTSVVLISGWDFMSDQALIKHYKISKTLQKPVSMKVLKKLFFNDDF